MRRVMRMDGRICLDIEGFTWKRRIPGRGTL